MLILTRKETESITINGNIRIIITKIQGKRVSVAIEAPKDIQVKRTDCIKHNTTRPHPQKITK